MRCFVTILTISTLAFHGAIAEQLILTAPHTRHNLILDTEQKRLWLDDCRLSLPLTKLSIQKNGNLSAEAVDQIEMNGMHLRQTIELHLNDLHGTAFLASPQSMNHVTLPLTVQKTENNICGK